MCEQLNLEERILIDYLLNVEKRNFAYISKKLSQSRSTISREIKRNTHDGVYLVNTADNRSKKRKLNKYFFYLFKYQKFSSLFAKYYNKRVRGVKATFFKIMTTHQKLKLLVGGRFIIELKVIAELSKLMIACEEHIENLQKENQNFCKI